MPAPITATSVPCRSAGTCPSPAGCPQMVVIGEGEIGAETNSRALIFDLRIRPSSTISWYFSVIEMSGERLAVDALDVVRREQVHVLASSSPART